MIKVRKEAGWYHKHLLFKDANLTAVKRDMDEFLEDKKRLEAKGYKHIELSFVREKGQVEKGTVVITLEGGNSLLNDLHDSEMLIDYDRYSYTLQSIFQPEDEVEEVDG